MRRKPDDDDENPFGGLFGGIDEMLSGVAAGDHDPVDVYEYDDEIRVVADIPNTSRTEIETQCDGRILAIHADRDPRPFLARVDLPAYVDDQSAELSFNNGVLEVRLDRETDPANIGFQ